MRARRVNLSILSAIVLFAVWTPKEATAQDTKWRAASKTADAEIDGPSNGFIEVKLTDDGRFSIGTTGGNPDNPNDDNLRMIFGHPNGGTTSFTTFRVNGQDTKNENTTPTSAPTTTGDTNATVYLIDGVEVTQLLTLVRGTTTSNADAVEIRYVMRNTTSSAADVGLRLMLDTMLGSNDSAPFRVPGVGDVVTEREFLTADMPQYYQVFDDLANPTLQVEGTLFGAAAVRPDRFVIAPWGSLNDNAWDYTVQPNRNLGDSAFSTWWDPVSVAPGASRTLVTYYGLAGVTTSTGDLTLGLTAPTALSRLDSGALSPDPFDAVAFIQNTGSAEATNVQATLTLPTGLTLASGSLTTVLGNVVPGAGLQANWQISPSPQAEGQLSFSVTISADNLASVSATRMIEIPEQTFAATDGDWTQQAAELRNTTEAQLMARTGDIDNLGFGWPTGFDPFSGGTTPAHSFPWTVDPTDAAGTDRIMVVSSYAGNPPAGQDGYTSGTSRPGNQPEAITLSFDPQGIQITGATLQMFLDDFQAPIWGADYQVTIDGVRAAFLEPSLNTLSQTGPVGRLLTFDLPAEFLPHLSDGSISILFDDPVTGAGDGFAVDFIKLLINPLGVRSQGTITGTVLDFDSGVPLADVLVTANGGASMTTAAGGAFTLDAVAAGLATVSTYRTGYGSETEFVNLQEGETAFVEIRIRSNPPLVASVVPAPGATGVSAAATISMNFDRAMDETSLTAGSFSVGSTSGSASGSITTSATGLVFSPTAPLESNTTYTAQLSAQARSEGGVPMESSYVWQFTTGTPAAAVTLGQIDINADPNAWLVESVAPIDSGFVFGTNYYQDQAKAMAFELPDGNSSAVVTGARVWWGYKADGVTTQTYSLELLAGDAASGPGSQVLHTQTLEMANVPADADLQTRHDPASYEFGNGVLVGSSFFISIDFGVYGAADWGNAAIVSTAGLNRRVDEVWEKDRDGDWLNVSDSWTGGANGWRPWIEVDVVLGGFVASEPDEQLPTSAQLTGAWPNPFNPQAHITFDLPQPGPVQMLVFDVMGRRVATLVDGRMPAGSHAVTLNAGQMASGTYVVRLVTGSSLDTHLVVLLK